LGGGGARGAAHIGVLMELERLGVRPDLITGTSMGGLVGGLVAAGLGTAEQVAFFQGILRQRVYSRSGGRRSLIASKKLEKLLVAMIGRPGFADLQIPLAVCTVDLVRRREVILGEGDVVSALLATAAFPVLLPPVEREGLTLIDGGVLNNLPFDVARARGATCVIAVELTTTAAYGTQAPRPDGRDWLALAMSFTQRQPLWQVLSTVTDIITTQSINTRMALSPPDVLIRPEMGTIGLFDFYRLEEAIAAGRAAVLAVEPALRTLVGY
jgi:NTE family protein